jgi:transcriptional regulator with PAS, ATPase and Fis domain
MEKKVDKPTLHLRLETVIAEMVDKEIRLNDALHEFQKIFIEQAAKKYKSNQTKMAKALGIHRNTLHCRSKKLKLLRK